MYYIYIINLNFTLQFNIFSLKKPLSKDKVFFYYLEELSFCTCNKHLNLMPSLLQY